MHTCILIDSSTSKRSTPRGPQYNRLKQVEGSVLFGFAFFVFILIGGFALHNIFEKRIKNGERSHLQMYKRRNRVLLSAAMSHTANHEPRNSSGSSNAKDCGCHVFQCIVYSRQRLHCVMVPLLCKNIFDRTTQDRVHK
jgi:hypothetical protein